MNADVELAVSVDADGVHVGREDAACSRARERLGDEAIIGVSCYNEYARAEAAAGAGASYIAFGAFFGSPTKPEAPRATTDLVVRARYEGVDEFQRTCRTVDRDRVVGVVDDAGAADMPRAAA